MRRPNPQQSIIESLLGYDSFLPPADVDPVAIATAPTIPVPVPTPTVRPQQVVPDATADEHNQAINEAIENLLQFKGSDPIPFTQQRPGRPSPMPVPVRDVSADKRNTQRTMLAAIAASLFGGKELAPQLIASGLEGVRQGSDIRLGDDMRVNQAAQAAQEAMFADQLAGYEDAQEQNQIANALLEKKDRTVRQAIEDQLTSATAREKIASTEKIAQEKRQQEYRKTEIQEVSKLIRDQYDIMSSTDERMTDDMRRDAALRAHELEQQLATKYDVSAPEEAFNVAYWDVSPTTKAEIKGRAENARTMAGVQMRGQDVSAANNARNNQTAKDIAKMRETTDRWQSSYDRTTRMLLQQASLRAQLEQAGLTKVQYPSKYQMIGNELLANMNAVSEANEQLRSAMGDYETAAAALAQARLIGEEPAIREAERILKARQGDVQAVQGELSTLKSDNTKLIQRRNAAIDTGQTGEKTVTVRTGSRVPPSGRVLPSAPKKKPGRRQGVPSAVSTPAAIATTTSSGMKISEGGSTFTIRRKK